MSRPKIKRNDQVVVIAGKDRGARGRVLRVLPAEGKAVVERVNLVKRHTKANPQRQVQGGILEKEAPIALSNLMLVCPESGKPTRVARKRTADGKAVRVAKRSGATFN
jgi:large subunit ribosomal protein L24